MTDTVQTTTTDTPVNDVQYTSLTIQGLQFEVKQPYKEGHVITVGEASQLNQVRAENIRNNFANTIRNAMAEYRKANKLAEDADFPVTDLDKDDLDEKLEEYDENYVMGVRGGATGPRTPSDPIGKEAYRIGVERVRAALKKRNIILSSISKEKMDDFVKSVIEKYPEITEEAKRRVTAGAETTVVELAL